ncbi:hypothetical protein B5S28_g180 [[Candida] boidinii]|nr:hypothetical protein B5S28_g180 [[Candida] boidinii]OWB59554.1 hypothetical protein B5S29_g413 [[Candida] boidinii]
MDFVYETYVDQNDTSSGSSSNLKIPPIPSGPLKLPDLNAYKDNLTKKITSLSILKDLSGLNNSSSGSDQNDDSESDKKAFEYAKISLELINDGTLAHKSLDPQLSMSSSDALGNRLARVLNTSNFDSSIRTSLVILQSRIDENLMLSKSMGTNVTSNKVTSNALDMQSSIFNDTASTIDYHHLADTNILGSVARRKLRGEVEKDLIKQHFQSLKKFQAVVRKLSVVKEDVDHLNATYTTISSKLTERAEDNSAFLETVDKLYDTRNSLLVKKELLNSFKNVFTLNLYEEHVLQNGVVNSEFFNVLKKAETIYDNCEVLLGMNNEKLGMDIMTKMNALIEKAIDRIADSIKKQLNSYFRRNEDVKNRSQEEADAFERSLVYILNKRESRFDEIVSEVTQSRSRSLLDEFLSQLNNYTETVKKEQKQEQEQKLNFLRQGRDIDSSLIITSYDSKRFISDLLAFLHGLIANEKELIDGLFTISLEHKDENFASSKNLEPVITSVLNKVISAISRPFKASFEQILRNESKPLILESLYSLLDLYGMMFGKVLSDSGDTITGGNTNLLTTLDIMKEMTVDKLLTVIQTKLKEVTTSVETDEIDDDLTIPDWIIDFYSLFLPIFNSVGYNDKAFLNLTDDKLADFFKYLFDGPLDLIEKTCKNSDQLKDDDVKTNVFKINCYDFIISKIISYPILQKETEKIQNLLNSRKAKLEDLEFKALITDCGLSDIYNLVNMIFSIEKDLEFFEVSFYEPITENKMFNVATFVEVNKKFQANLPFVLLNQQEKTLSKLTSPLISSDVSYSSSIRFVNFYYRLTLIINEFLKTSDGYPVDPLTWDDFHVATLLGIDEEYSKQRYDFTSSADLGNES